MFCILITTSIILTHTQKKGDIKNAVYESHYSVKYTKNTHFMSYFYKQKITSFHFFLMFYSTSEVRESLHDAKIMYGCKKIGWMLFYTLRDQIALPFI
jgi:hypothetical protein